MSGTSRANIKITFVTISLLFLLSCLSMAGASIGRNNFDRCHRAERYGVSLGLLLDLPLAVAYGGVPGGLYGCIGLASWASTLAKDDNEILLPVWRFPAGETGRAVRELSEKKRLLRVVLLSEARVVRSNAEEPNTGKPKVESALNEYGFATPGSRDYSLLSPVYRADYYRVARVDVRPLNAREYAREKIAPLRSAKPGRRASPDELVLYLKIPGIFTDACLKTEPAALLENSDINKIKPRHVPLQALLWDPLSDKRIYVQAAEYFSPDGQSDPVAPGSGGEQAVMTCDTIRLRGALWFTRAAANLIDRIQPRVAFVDGARIATDSALPEANAELELGAALLSCPNIPVSPQTWERFADLNRGALKNYRGDPQTVAAVYHNLGLYALHRGELERALRNFQRSLESNPEASGLREYTELVLGQTNRLLQAR